MAEVGGDGVGGDEGRSTNSQGDAACAAQHDSDTTADNAGDGAATALRLASESAAAFASLRFAILISGFPSRSPAHADLMVSRRQKHGDSKGSQRTFAPLAIPAFHMWGSADMLVPPAASSLLARQFSEATRQALVHDGGHFVPGSADVRRQIAAFVAQFRVPAALEGRPDERAGEDTRAAQEATEGDGG
jgi:pimeloyl-ACP methyl ester carboxylesterase